MPKKLTYEYVKEFIESVDGYKLLSTEYVNNKKKLDIMCPDGHIFEMTIDNFKNKKERCSKCFGTPKFTYEYVKEFIEAVGYTLLSTEYINIQSKLEMICPEGHHCNMIFNNFKNNGARCAECAGLKKYTLEYIKEFLEAVGYKLLSKEYIEIHSKLKIQCPDDHITEMVFHSFKKGHRCRDCYLINNFGENNPNWNSNREELEITNRIRKRFNTKWGLENMKHDPKYHSYCANPDKYHIDHILPIAGFRDFLVEQNLDEKRIKRIANHKRNLQILLKSDNSKKHSKYNPKKLQEYIDRYY